MRTIRLTAAATILLVAVYFAFRALAMSCSGTGCDAYIPVSLLIPLLILMLVAVTSALATIRARGRRAWFAGLAAATVIGVAGPIAALLLFKDSPDAFVPAATILVLVAAGTALAFSFWPARSSAPS